MNPFLLPLGAVAAAGPKNLAKTGLFGAPVASWWTPGINGAGGPAPSRGAFETPGIGDGVKQEAAPQTKSYMDSFSGKLGAIGDILLRASGNGGNPHYAMMMQQDMQNRAAQQRAQQMQQQAMQDRQWAREDKQWEWANAPQKPVNNDTVNDFEWYKGLNEADRALYHQMKPEYRQGPDGRFYPVERGMVPTAPVGKLTPIGGGTGGNVGGTFRP